VKILESDGKKNTLKDAFLECEARINAIAEGYQGILVHFDCDLKVKWVNRVVKSSYPDAAGRSCDDIFCSRSESCQFCSIKLCLETGSVESFTRTVVNKDNPDEETVFDIIGSPVKDTDGNVTGVIGIVQNVTEQYSLERQLRHTQKMEAIGTLAGGVAHDFNNVLTPIMGYTEILRFKMRQMENSDPTFDTYLEEILKAARRAKSLVEQVLTFSRTNEKKAILQFLHPIVKEAMKLLRVTLPTTITIREDIQENCGRVLIDPVQIHQVLINLCTNASDAMAGRHGELTVSLQMARPSVDGKDWLELCVSDTGEGISEENLERIFDPYFSTKEKTRGTGMGLSMVHGIINNQGGFIHVESELGLGTTFKVYLPVSYADTPVSQIVSQNELIRGEGNILLVDDDEQVLQVTGELLKNLGYNVTGNASPEEALEVFSKAPDYFDLVITDLTMPGLTGLELSEKIAAMRPDIDVILVSGYSDKVARDDAKAAGISDFCMKPISIRELSGVVGKALARPGVGSSAVIH
jgi:two-component system cell cycle sensor histidine kinase/response regulator CckA